MSSDDSLRLREITVRLDQITKALGSEELEDREAGELTKEAADLAAEAVEQTNRLMRAADTDR